MRTLAFQVCQHQPPNSMIYVDKATQATSGVLVSGSQFADYELKGLDLNIRLMSVR